MNKLVVYLNFPGTCREAMTFYQQCLGGELHLSPFTDADFLDSIPEAFRSGIMHARLHNGFLTLMASDSPHTPVVNGNSVILSLACDSPAEAKRLFDALAAGGNVLMPLADQFWGAYFGMLTDQFGIQWMIDHEYPKGELSPAAITAAVA